VGLYLLLAVPSPVEFYQAQIYALLKFHAKKPLFSSSSGAILAEI
jgi:hypothetical protein